MADQLRYPAEPELADLLRRYYTGQAGLWAEIQAHVAADLRARGLGAAPRHLRFRRGEAGYEVIVEDAADYAQ